MSIGPTPVEKLWRGALRAAWRFSGSGGPTPEVKELASMVARLLSHYWTADDSPEMREAQVYDWLKDLSHFPQPIVEEAVDEWRRRPGGRRPTPGDVCAVCVRLWNESREREQYQRALPAPEVSDADLDRLADEWARGAGYPSIAAMQHARHFTGCAVKLGGRSRVYRPLWEPEGHPHREAVAGFSGGEKTWSSAEMKAARRQLGLAD